MHSFLKVNSTITTLLAILTSNLLVAQPNYPTNPENAELIYTDVRHFVEAYNQLNTESDTIAVLKKHYFDKGSKGLHEFISRHKLTPELLRDALAKSPDDYAKIGEFLSNENTFKEEFKGVMHDYSKVLPSAMYPPTYLLVGANRGIGQASREGQLITITRVADNHEKLTKLIVHELSHFQQALAMGPQNYGALYGKPNNMLDLCLREGGAEFITFLVIGDITQTKGLEYLENNELDMKSKFLNDLSNQNAKFWLWDSIDDPNTPHLLGYVMGHKICEAYYNQHSDKEQALKDILIMKVPEEFVKGSGYLKI